MKRLSLYIALFLIGSTLFSQKSITPNVLKDLQESYQNNGTEKAIRNAVNGTSLKQLTLNRDTKNATDTWFSHKVNSSGITNQLQSGRCWLFTGTNVIRATVMAKTGMKNFQFSQVYTFFYDQLEKSNLFLLFFWLTYIITLSIIGKEGDFHNAVRIHY